MPFRSKAQMKAAFSGGLGSKMKKRAKLWAEHTPNIEELPEHADTEKSLNLWKGKIISLDMAYEEKLLKARTPGAKDIKKRKKRNILQTVREATHQGLLKPGLSMSPSKWKEYLKKREIEAGN